MKRIKSAALVLLVAMFFNVFPVQALAVVAQNEKSIEKSLRAELRNSVDEAQYPNGMFEFIATRMNTSENLDSVEFAIVRKGGTNGKASITLKSIDVTAQYGKDYTLSIPKGIFKQTLPENEEAKPLLESLSSQDEPAAVMDEADASDNLQEQTTPATEEINSGDNEEEPAEETKKESVPATSVSVQIDAATEITSIEGEEQPVAEPQAQSEEHPITALAAEAEYEELTLSKSNAQEPSVKKMSLREAKEAFTGKKSDRLDWRTAEEKEKKAAIEAYNETYQGIPGITCVLEFAEGEYIKKIRFNTIDDKISEDEEQVLLVLLDPVGASLGEANNGFMNIQDNEEKEKVEFELAEKEITVDPSSAYAEVTVNRTSGLYRYGLINIGTAALTAQPEIDYSPVMTELRFVPGQASQKVRIPILDGADEGKKEELKFWVKLDNDSANLAENGNVSALVTIKTAPETTDNNSNNFRALAESNNIFLKNNTFSPMATTGWTEYNGKWYKTKSIGLEDVVDSYGQYKWPGMDWIYLDINGYTDTHRRVTLPVDLTMVDVIKWDWSNPSKGTSYIDGWDWFKTKYWTDFYSYFQIGDINNLTKQGSFQFIWNEIYPANRVLNETERKQKVIYFGTYTRNKTMHSEFNLGRVYLLYTPITVNLIADKDNLDNVDANITSKIWTSSASYQNNESSSQYIGSLAFSDDKSVIKRTYYDGDVAWLSRKFDEKFTDTAKVYLWGYKIERIGGLADYTKDPEPEPATNETDYSEINKYYYVQGDSLNIRNLYTNNMKDYKGRNIPRKDVLMDNNTLVLYPIYKAKNAYVKLNFDAAKGAMVQNSFTNGETIKIGMLDEVKYKVAEKTGYAVSGYEHGHFNIYTRDITSDNDERFLHTYTVDSGDQTIKSNPTKLKPIDGISINPALPNELVFHPQKTFSNLTVQYGPSFLRILVHPKSALKDKGSVAYFPNEEGQSAQDGNYMKSLLIDPMLKNKLYTISGVPDEGYRVVWNDFSGDESPQDGKLVESEIRSLGIYNGLFNRTPVNGSFFNYIPQYGKPIIYYSFEKREPGSMLNEAFGTVSLAGNSILERSFNKSVEEKPLAGIEVLIDGFKTTTDAKGDFSIENEYFINNQFHTVIVDYKDKKYTGHLQTNVWEPIVIKEYDSFVPGNFKIIEKNTDGNVEVVPRPRIGADGKTIINTKVENKDANFQFSFDVEAIKPGLSADKAIFRVYSKEGFQRGEPIEITPQAGGFSFTFNPAQHGVVPGDTMTLQFADQNGKEYLEHQVGITFIKYLDTFSLLSSFKSPVSGVIDMVGSMDAAFDLGLAGKLNDYKTETDDGWIIKFGFNKSWEKELGEKTFSEELKSAAKNPDHSDSGKKAVDTNNEEKKKASLTADMKFDLSTALYLKMKMDDTGNAYFQEMIMSATVSGEFNTTAEIMTPIGVTVFIKLSLSGEINATMVIEQYHSKKFYFNENGEIDFSNAGVSNPDRDFTIYGKFSVKPSLSITVGAKITGAEISINGTAFFDMNFTTSGSGNGKVRLSAQMALKILVFDFKWDIAEKTWDLFDNSRSMNFNANSLFADTDYLYESAEGYEISSREYLKNREGWQGSNTSGAMRLMAAGENVFNEQTLQTGVYPYPYTLLAPIGENQQLLVFLDDDTKMDDRNRTQAYYSIYNGSSWSQPQKIDNDGTPDDNPWISDMGDRVLVAWSSAVDPVDENDTVMKVLNNRNIKARFFDKKTWGFGEVQNVTHETDSDIWSDTDPYIAYWEDKSGQENLMITYTKTQYTSTSGGDKDAVVGDIINAYSALSYRFYDFNKNCWEVSEDENGYYGQGFIDVAKYAEVDETDLLIPDDDEDWKWRGYWSRIPDTNEITMKDLGSDPLIVDSNAIGYEDFAVFAYSIDMDKDIATTGDRELFIQLYSFTEKRFYPAIHFDDTKGQTDLEFVESNDNVYLYFISDGDIVSIDIGNLFSQNFLSYERNDIDGEDGNVLVLNKLKGIYKKPEVVVQHQYETRIDESGQEYRINEHQIDQFMVKSDDDNVYVMWTESNLAYRNGIEANSREATLPANQYREKQILAARQVLGGIVETPVYDEEGNPLTYPAQDEKGNQIDYNTTPDINGHIGVVKAGDPIIVETRSAEWSEPVTITDEKGANFNDIDFEILSDGDLRVVFVKGMSEIMNVAGIDMAVENVNNRVLMTADYNAQSVLAEVSVQPLPMPKQNEVIPVQVELKNKGLNWLKDVTVELYQVSEDGEAIVGEATDLCLRGGAEQKVHFIWEAPEKITAATLKVLVKQGEEILCSARQDIIAESLIDIIDVRSEALDRHKLKLTGTAVNSGNMTANDAKVYASVGGKVAGSITLGALPPGEEETFALTVDVEPQMYASSTGLDDSVRETVNLLVYANGQTARVTSERYARKDQIDIVNNIKGFTLKAGDHEITNNLSLQQGTVVDIEPALGYSDETLPYPRLVYISSDESVADFSQGNMTLSGKNTGTATITVYALPPNSGMVLSADSFEIMDNFTEVANAAVKVKGFVVNVYRKTNGSAAVNLPPVTVPTDSTATTTTNATVDNSGKAEAAVTSAQINAAIGQAVDAVAKLVIKVEAPPAATSITTTIPALALQEANHNIQYLTVATPIAEITLDNQTMTAIAAGVTEDIKITASRIETSRLPEGLQDILGDRPIFDFSVTSGKNVISQFAGNVTISIPYTPRANEDSNAIVIYYLNEEGLPEIVSNCVYHAQTGRITFKTNHFSQFAVGYNPVIFKDVAPDAWYSNAVGFAAARGITTGTGNDNFSPDMELTRAQFLVMAMRAYGIKPSDQRQDNFQDAGNSYYSGYLAAAKAAGITKGTGGNLFKPEDEISRQEMFTLLYNILKLLGQLPEGKEGESLHHFNDGDMVAPWAYDAIALFAEAGIISGSNGKLSPEDTGNRAQMAQVVYHLLSR